MAIKKITSTEGATPIISHEQLVTNFQPITNY